MIYTTPRILVTFDLVTQTKIYPWFIQLSAENETSNLILILIEQENVTEENEEKRECII